MLASLINTRFARRGRCLSPRTEETQDAGCVNCKYNHIDIALSFEQRCRLGLCRVGSLGKHKGRKVTEEQPHRLQATSRKIFLSAANQPNAHPPTPDTHPPCEEENWVSPLNASMWKLAGELDTTFGSSRLAAQAQKHTLEFIFGARRCHASYYILGLAALSSLLLRLGSSSEPEI